MDVKKLNPRHWLADEDKRSEWMDDAKTQYHDSIDYLQRELDRLRGGILYGAGQLPSVWPSNGRENLMLRPKVDIAEQDDHYTISVEIPGVEKEDVTLEIEGHTLHISGEKKRESERREEDYHRIERAYGTFRRSLNLPDDVKTDKVEARYHHGVITITVPRATDQKKNAQKIEIKAA